MLLAAKVGFASVLKLIFLIVCFLVHFYYLFFVAWLTLGLSLTLVHTSGKHSAVHLPSTHPALLIKLFLFFFLIQNG